MNYRPYIKKDYKDVLGQPLLHARRQRHKWPLLIIAAIGAALAVNISAGIGQTEREPTQTPAAIPLELPWEGAVADDTAPTAAPEAGPLKAVERTVVSAVPPSGGKGTTAEPQEAAAPQDPAPAPAPDTIQQGATADQEVTETTVVVKRGDTLSGIFGRLKLDRREMYRLLGDRRAKRRLSRLRPGQELQFRVGSDNRIHSLAYRIDDVTTLTLSRNSDGFNSELLKEQLNRRLTSTTGQIRSSLFQAAQKAGLSDGLIMQMVEVLGWDIDFATDIRSGDDFTVIYEQLLNARGETIGEGHIVAVSFTNQDRQIRAVRYTDPSGHSDYYSNDGYSMRKAFLRTPVNFSRISSRFSKGRYHPVLNRIRAHKGVDYAAPVGTPVKATGDGTVSFKNWKGGFGRTVIIQHGEKYTTLYAHLSRYAKGLRPGKRVRQGQVIGFVGKSGLATGPHLHYEFRIGNQHRDPLRVRLPKANPIAEKYREDFIHKSKPLIAQLERLRHTQVAQGGG